jgi:acetylornithine deacetylase/succinyl-diaminopimelate desuccinylase-like protein
VKTLAACLVAVAFGSARAAPPEKRDDGIVEQARAILEKLVAAETVGRNETAALRPIAELFRSAGVPATIVESAPGRGNLIARLKGDGSKRPLLLMAHVDVVAGDGQPWTTPPFRLVQKDGYLYGRGVNDDKGMAAAIVAVALELRRTRARLSRDVVVALTAGEETGGHAGVGWLVEHRPELLDAEIGLNEGNGGGITLSDDLSHVLEVDVGLGQKTYQTYVVRARGRGGHSSMPLVELDPVYPLAASLQRIAALRFPPRVLPATRPGIAAYGATQKPPLADALRRGAETGSVSPDDDAILSKDAIANAFVRTTCVATMLKGSSQENVLPVAAEATIQCRLLPGDTVESVKEVLERTVAETGVAGETSESSGSGVALPAEGEVPDAIRRVTERFWGKVPVVPSFGFGSSDDRFLTPRGVRVYGAHPCPGSNEDARQGYGAHGPDERVPVRWYSEGVRWFHALVLELAR